MYIKENKSNKKVTKKQLKRRKSKNSKERKFFMLDSLVACFFMSLNVKKISTDLNE